MATVVAAVVVEVNASSKTSDATCLAELVDIVGFKMHQNLRKKRHKRRGMLGRTCLLLQGSTITVVVVVSAILVAMVIAVVIVEVTVAVVSVVHEVVAVVEVVVIVKIVA